MTTDSGRGPVTASGVGRDRARSGSTLDAKRVVALGLSVSTAVALMAGMAATQDDSTSLQVQPGTSISTQPPTVQPAPAPAPPDSASHAS